MNRRITAALLFALALPMSNSVKAAGEPGWFGLGFSVETEGFSFNPTLKSVKIEKVVPSSPAAGAGLVAGDQVLALQGMPVAGAKADKMKDAMKKSVGESITMKIQHGTAEPHDVTLVAAARP